MVYRRKDRPREGFRVWPTLPDPWGRVGPWQTGLYRKNQAEQVEAWLHEMARTRPELIDALVSRRFSLETAWIAKLRSTLDALLAGVNDPLLTDAIDTYRPRCKDERARTGLDQIAAFAPDRARLSWLAGKNIRTLYENAQDQGLKPNSVKRTLHRAVSELLTYHLGDEQRAAALKGVPVPSAADERLVQVGAEEIQTLLDACEPARFRLLVMSAISSAIDRKPLLALRARDLNDETGVLDVMDTKNKKRKRKLRLGPFALSTLRLAIRDLQPNERVFPWTEGQVRHLWEAARDSAAGRPTREQRRYRQRTGQPVDDLPGEAAAQLFQEKGVVTLPLLRFKDLRHVLPTVLAELGVDRREIQEYMGHAPGSKQTDRYITPRGDPEKLRAAEERLGLSGIHLRAVGD